MAWLWHGCAFVKRARYEEAWRRCWVLFGGLACAKLVVVALRAADGGGRLLLSAWSVPAFLYQDFALAFGVLALDCAGLRLCEKSALGRLGVARAAWALVVVLVAYAAVNVVVARVFSTPLTLPMLGATGAALSDSILGYATFGNVASVFAVAATAAVLARALPHELTRKKKLGFFAVGAACLLLGPIGAARIETLGLHRNAALTLARSWFARVPELKPTAIVTSLPAEGHALDLTHLTGAARGRNVVWVILESTAAEYLGAYAASPDPAPNLTRLAAGALVFDAAYCATPESIKGLFSMLCSTHPAPQTSASDYVVDRVPCPSIAGLLSGAGYRTAFFHSGRFRYLGMQGIVDGRGFDVAHDAETIGGRHRTSFGTDDASTVQKLLGFVDQLPPGQRFFAVYSPIAGHHPYKSPGEGPRPFTERSERERYLNDLYAGDAALGSLLDGFTSRGLAERTLFVVMGDHGEAFQQHEGNFAHTLFLYEENVRVPLIVAAPGLTLATLRVPQIASATDLAPTTLALLGLPIDPRQEGRSLLDAAPGYARFFTDHGPLKVGLRHGSWKFIHETEHDRSRLFQLADDPSERLDLAEKHAERAARYRRHLLEAASMQRARLRDYPGR